MVNLVELVKKVKWLISDPHFGHENIIKYCERPFSSVEEMDNTMIENWNSVVNNGETVLILGDFALSSPSKTMWYGQQLKGDKYLIKGNHDRRGKSLYAEGGITRLPKRVLLKPNLILSHRPEKMEEGCINIHGHIHQYTLDSNEHVNVSVEQINYTPVLFESIVEKQGKFWRFRKGVNSRK